MPGRRITWGLILLAIAVRASAVIVLQSHTVPRSTYEHGEIAANLLAGRGFSVEFLGGDGPTSQQAPVYPVLVAAAYAVGGVETPRSLLILELSQAILGGLLVVGVLRLASEVAPNRPRIAAVAGFVAALHPALVYAATHVQVALVAATALVWTIAMAYRTARTGAVGDAIVTGALLAFLTLTDPILALAFLGIAVVLVQARGGRLALRPLALIALASGIGVAPWIIRNAWVHGELVLVKSSFGYAFWQGNCAKSEGTDKVVRPSVDRALSQRSDGLKGLNESLWAARHEAGCIDDIVLTAADRRELGAVSEPERSRRLFRQAIADLRADPWRYPQLCLRRLRYFTFFDETNPKSRNRIYRASHLVLTFAALGGLVLARRRVRRRLLPTVATALAIAVFHSLTIVSARFHIPLEPLMGIWAACGLTRFGSNMPAGDVFEGFGLVEGRLRGRALRSRIRGLAPNDVAARQDGSTDHRRHRDSAGRDPERNLQGSRVAR
jgi:hypothetical protein